MGLSHAPLSLVCKAVAVMSEDILLDAVPQAWEMLLEYENEVSFSKFFLFPAIHVNNFRFPAQLKSIHST